MAEKLSELGLKRVDAYVRDGREKKKVSKAAEEKRKYRAQRKAEGIGQFVVEVPEDDDAKHALYAVAKAIVDDKANNKKVRSIVLSLLPAPRCSISSNSFLELRRTFLPSPKWLSVAP